MTTSLTCQGEEPPVLRVGVAADVVLLPGPGASICSFTAAIPSSSSGSQELKNDDIFNMMPPDDASSSACASSSYNWFCCKRMRKHPLLVQGDKTMKRELIQKIQTGINKVDISKRPRTSTSCSSTKMMCKRKKLSNFASNRMRNIRGQGRADGSCCAVLDVAALLVYYLLAADAAVVLVTMLVWDMDLPRRSTGGGGFFVAATIPVRCMDVVAAGSNMMVAELARQLEEAQKNSMTDEAAKIMVVVQRLQAAYKKGGDQGPSPDPKLEIFSLVIPPYCGNYIPGYPESPELEKRKDAYIQAFEQKTVDEKIQYMITPKMQADSQASIAADPAKFAEQCCLPGTHDTNFLAKDKAPNMLHHLRGTSKAAAKADVKASKYVVSSSFTPPSPMLEPRRGL
ncbi:unnamed protein product [Amoebophrya sp. A25]|nr:unnamed protein product [Amoebophrya sp. A25]|eukprot:GSA25T00021186001.1